MSIASKALAKVRAQDAKRRALSAESLAPSLLIRHLVRLARRPKQKEPS